MATGFMGCQFVDVFNDEVINPKELKILILSLNISLVLLFVVSPPEWSRECSLNEHIC